MSVAPATAPETPRRRLGLPLGRPKSLAWLAVPALLLIAVMFVYPTVRILLRSFTEGAGGLTNYGDVLGSGGLLRIIGRSVLIAGVVTAVSLVAGYIYAYAAVISGPKFRATLLALVGASLFVSVIVRGYSWLAILGRNGALDAGFEAIGLGSINPVLVPDFTGIVVGMVQYGIPFMVLALYDVMRRVDPNLTKAAATLGARPTRAFFRVYLPLTMPGVIAGCVIVFITTLGYYILPSILGGPQNTMVGQVIAERIQTTLDWASATALAGILLAVSIAGFVAFMRVTRRQAVAHG